MTFNHAIVWMDSKEARVFRFNADTLQESHIKSHNPYRKIHHKAGVIGSGHTHLNHEFFDGIGAALQGVSEWLLTGPGHAKDELTSYLKEHLAGLKQTLLGVETLDHPTDGELLAHARRFFKTADKMRANSPAPKH
jgi:stalled ribosome rescue protein Dom34